MKTKFVLYILISLFFLVIFFLVNILLGSVSIPLNEIIDIIIFKKSLKAEWITIIYEFRIPKAITAVIVGIALSVSGLQMQTVFKNPLAGPYVLGISSGASLGVAILVLGLSSTLGFNFHNIFGSWSLVIFACTGAAFILILIMLVSIKIKDILAVLILGVMLGSAISAFVNILQYFSPENLLKAFVIWTMGSLGGVTKSQLNVLIIAVIVGLSIAVSTSKQLNALLLGDDYAKSLGINIRKSQFLIFLSTSILAGSVTAFCGPIGFIGIAVPHITRMIYKTANQLILIVSSSINGAIIILISDIISLFSII